MNKELLYESLGELMYVVAMADGIIQDEELNRIKEIIKDHPYADTIRWSFDFSRAKDASIDEVYQKVIDQCYVLGPLPEYSAFIDMVSSVAESSEGVSEEEGMVINSFATELLVRFRTDLMEIKTKA